MYLLLYFVLAGFTTCHSLIENDEKNESHCVHLRELLESSSVSVEINKRGFHREVVTTVMFGYDAPSGVEIMLLHRWPSSVYVDPYQLESLRGQSDWQVLLDSVIDLELPAHKASGFVTYVYLTTERPTSGLVKVTIPIHGRYNEPSFDGKTMTSVDIDAPELLLWSENCMPFQNLEAFAATDAPCTPSNSSTCTWVKHQHQQEKHTLHLQFPVGDASLLMPVCIGTLLVTMICCLTLSKYMWEHQIM